MAIFNSLTGACEAQLRYMSQYQGINYAFNLRPINGTLQFLASDYNARAAGADVIEISDQRGKVKQTRIIYSQRGKYTDAQTGSAGINATVCDTTHTREEKSVLVPISKRIATRPLKFTNEQLNEICENTESFMQKYFLDELASAREAMDRIVLADLDAAKGKIIHYDGTTTSAGSSKSLKLITVNSTTTERTPIFSNYNKIKLDLQKMQLRGTPAIIGESVINEFFDLMGYACCNSVTPFADAIRGANSAFFLDQNADTILGTGDFLVVAPGSFLFLTYNENKSIDFKNDLVKHYVMPDPEVPGLMWDVDFKWDECEKAYIWFASVWYDTFGTFQDDSFASGDFLDNITGVYGYTGTAS